MIGVRNVTLFHGSYPDFIKSIGPGNTLVLCGGTHFHDDYNPARLLRHWLYLARINYLFGLCKEEKALKRFASVTDLAPLSKRITQQLTKQFCKLCDVITVRDKSSQRALLVLNRAVDLTHPDLAMLLYRREPACGETQHCWHITYVVDSAA